MKFQKEYIDKGYLVYLELGIVDNICKFKKGKIDRETMNNEIKAHYYIKQQPFDELIDYWMNRISGEQNIYQHLKYSSRLLWSIGHSLYLKVKNASYDEYKNYFESVFFEKLKKHDRDNIYNESNRELLRKSFEMATSNFSKLEYLYTKRIFEKVLLIINSETIDFLPKYENTNWLKLSNLEKMVVLVNESNYNNSYEKIRLNSKIRDLITSKFFDEFDKLSDCERNIFFYSDNFKKKSIFPGLKFFTYPCENISDIGVSFKVSNFLNDYTSDNLDDYYTSKSQY